MNNHSNLCSEIDALRRRIAELEAQLSKQAGEQPIAPGAPTEGSVQFRALFTTMAQGVIYQNAAGEIIMANPAAERILGLSLDEMQGRTSIDPRWHAIREDGSPFPGEEHPAMVALRSGQPVNDVMMGVFHPRTSTYRWILVSATPEFRAGDHQPFQVYTTFTDLTERKQMEEALRENEELLRLAYESAELGIWINDLVTGAVRFDERARMHYGFACADATLADVLRVVHPEDGARLGAEIAAATAPTGSGKFATEYRVLHPDGSVHWLAVGVRVKFEGAGEQRRAVMGYGTSMDITARKQSEHRLRESEERFRSFFETSAAVMLIIEPDSGAIVDANPAAADFYGYSRLQLERMNITDINQLPPDAVARERLRAKTKQQSYFIFPHKLASGEMRTVEVRSHPIQTDGRTLLFSLVYDITEPQQVEARLNLEQRKLAQIAASVPGLIYSFRQPLDGVASMPYAGPMIRDVLGLDPAEMAEDTAPLFARIHPDDLDLVFASIDQSARSMTPWHSEFRYNHPQKGRVWLEGRSMPTLQPDGSLLWHGFLADITERKQTEQLVYAQRDLARSIGSVASMEVGLQLCFETALRISGLECGGIYLFDSDHTVLELVHHQGLSPAFVQEVATYPFESQVAQSILTGAFIYRLIDEAGPQDLYRREGLRTVCVAPIRFRDSVIGCLNLGAHAPTPVSDFVREGLDTLATEIGNYIVYLRASLSLRQSEERYRLLANELEQRVRQRTAEVQDLYDNAPTGYHSLDAEGRFVMINQTEANWLGYTREELIGRRFADIVTPDSLETFKANFPAFKQRGWVRDLEFDLVRRDGSTFPVLLSATAISDAAGAYLMSRSTVFDNTDRRIAEVALRDSEAQLRQSRDQLSAANAALGRAARMKDEFLASMSHELRTPLNSILGLAEALQMQIYGALNEKQRRSLSTIESSGRHLLELINDILDLSKIEAGMLELDIKPVELADVCQIALQLVKGLAHNKGHQVGFSMTPAKVTVRGDERRLKQMLVNLLSNAIKFTPAGRQLGLEVSADSTAETVSLTVWDQGIGIAPTDVEWLFQPFAQFDRGLARQYEGSGLGLPLVRSMTELHGGSIQVESQPGEGSRFTIVLPWRQSGVAPLERTSGARSQKTALVADDDTRDTRRLTQFLSVLGLEAITHPLELGIVESAASTAPQVILLTLNTLDAPDTAVLAALKQDQRTRAIPVVLCAAVGNRTQALEQGAAGYLAHPVLYVDLRDELVKLGIGAAELSLQAEACTSNPRVMLADDNEVIIETLTDFLESQGCAVTAVRSGLELLDAAPALHPDIILMDIQMPMMDGLQAIRRIRAHADPALAKTPIIALTALAMRGDRERCLAAGANDYLSKPVALVELLTLIRKYAP